LGGERKEMKKIWIVLVALAIIAGIASANNASMQTKAFEECISLQETSALPEEEWRRTFGGAGADNLPCTCGDICVNETGWWRAGGSFYASNTLIQDAIYNASEGDTICVKDGTYNENVDVNKRLTIRSENGSASTIVNATAPTDHVFDVTTDYVNICGFTVIGSLQGYGIHLNNTNHCNISDNGASNNSVGIVLNYSNNNAITDNNASDNLMGIVLNYSSHNPIYNNYFNNIINAYDDGNNIWNIQKTSGMNIIGGP